MSKTELHVFLEGYFKSSDFKTEGISNSASARNYFRIFFEGKTYIALQSNGIEENKTFLYFNAQLEKIKASVPKVVSISDNFSMYLQEDKGDENLLFHLQNTEEKEWKPLVEKCITDLVQIQTELPKVLDFEKSFEFKQLDEKVILNDLFYFKNYFIEYLDIPYQKGKLIDDFFAISKKVQALPNNFFLYRDFQSRNIMINGNQPFYIDYQGGMKGIACYDLVSFSWQAKANFSSHYKEELKQLYFKEIQKKNEITVEELEQSYQLSLIIRLFQLLGAYGFRGLVQQKPHFKESIFQTIENIQYLLQNNYLKDYTELEKLTKEYIQNDKIKI